MGREALEEGDGCAASAVLCDDAETGAGRKAVGAILVWETRGTMHDQRAGVQLRPVEVALPQRANVGWACCPAQQWSPTTAGGSVTSQRTRPAHLPGDSGRHCRQSCVG